MEGRFTDIDEAREKLSEIMDEWPEFKGFTVFRACPGCLKILLSWKDVEKTAEGLRKMAIGESKEEIYEGLSQAMKFWSITETARFLPFIPYKHLARKLDWRIVWFALCKDCEPFFGSQSFAEKCENNFVNMRKISLDRKAKKCCGVAKDEPYENEPYESTSGFANTQDSSGGVYTNISSVVTCFYAEYFDKQERYEDKDIVFRELYNRYDKMAEKWTQKLSPAMQMGLKNTDEHLKKHSKIIKEWSDFNGFSIFRVCPGCLKNMLSQEEAEKITNRLKKIGMSRTDEERDKKIAEGMAVWSSTKSGLTDFIPYKHLAEKLDCRIVLFKLCKDCEPFFWNSEFPGFMEKCENNFVRYSGNDYVVLKDATTPVPLFLLEREVFHLNYVTYYAFSGGEKGDEQS